MVHAASCRMGFGQLQIENGTLLVLKLSMGVARGSPTAKINTFHLGALVAEDNPSPTSNLRERDMTLLACGTSTTSASHFPTHESAHLPLHGLAKPCGKVTAPGSSRQHRTYVRVPRRRAILVSLFRSRCSLSFCRSYERGWENLGLLS